LKPVIQETQIISSVLNLGDGGDTVGKEAKEREDKEVRGLLLQLDIGWKYWATFEK
jgi:hypothetical protein